MKKYLKSSDSVEGALFFVISVLGIIFSIKSHSMMDMDWKLSPYLFPLAISIMLFALSISLLIEGRKKEEAKKDKSVHYRDMLLYILICFIYYLLLPYVGFLVSTVVFLIFTFRLLGLKKWSMTILLSVVATLFVYILFARLLHVMLPSGSIYYYLGL
ncbi:MAG: tripartite tricarboxylate transporter TctB family protein [Sphaerochaetaceae bacterium]|nr:tripartite tricarboxylate transporter TctB family protein [Sphaerochaetaceae bacterium]